MGRGTFPRVAKWSAWNFTKFRLCIEQMLSKYVQNVIFFKNDATFFMKIFLVLNGSVVRVFRSNFFHIFIARSACVQHSTSFHINQPQEQMQTRFRLILSFPFEKCDCFFRRGANLLAKINSFCPLFEHNFQNWVRQDHLIYPQWRRPGPSTHSC